MKTLRSNRTLPPVLVGILLFSWALLSFRLSTPYFGQVDNFQVWVAASVRNLDAYPPQQTGWMVVRNMIPGTEPLAFYSHHPPLVTWIPYLVTRIVGFHELGVRYTFAAAMLLSAAALFVFARRLYGERIALWTAAFYTLTPMVVYFGRVPNHDQIGLVPSLLFGAVMVNWLRQPTRPRLLLLALLAWFSAWSSWPAVFFVGVFGFAGMIFGKRPHSIAIVGLGVLTASAIVLMMVYYRAVWPGALDSIVNAFSWRTSTAAGRLGAAAFTPVSWIGQNVLHLIFFATPSLLILALGGVFALRKRTPFANGMLLALLGGAITYFLVFRNATYIHNYYKMLVIPGMSIGAAATFTFIPSDERWRRRARLAKFGLLAALLIWSAMIFGLLHLGGIQPAVEAMIARVRDVPAETPVMAFVGNPQHQDESAYEGVIEFYALHEVEWNVSWEDAIAASTNSPVFYLYCLIGESSLPEPLLDYPAQSVYGNACYAFWLS